MKPINVRKIPDLFQYQLDNYPLKRSLSGKKENNTSYSFSTEQLSKLIISFSSGLLKRGIKKGDKISLISYNNTPEWNVADLGMLKIGAINVSVYPNISPDDYVYIFNNAKVKYCIVGQGDILNKVLKAQQSIPSLECIFTFDSPKIQVDVNSNQIECWDVLLDKNPDLDLVSEAGRTFEEESLATIIYTSGTTGTPKGVMLTHKNIVSNAKEISKLMLFDSGDSALSYLPLCHGFERTLVYCYMFKGMEVNYALNQQTIGESLKEVRPHVMTAVPRILEKAHEKIVNKVQKKSLLSRMIFNWADRLSHKFEYGKTFGPWYNIQKKIADRLVYSEIRNSFGGRLKALAVGASACPEKILKFFCAAGIPVIEGYGLTETSAVLSFNRMNESGSMLGTVGMLLPGFELRISGGGEVYREGEGEILVRGDSVTSGYYNDPERTKEIFNDEGWLLTGDIGMLVKDDSGNEFIKLTDRIKELMKSSNGKYVAPVAIENLVKENSFVSQIMVIGEQRNYVSALIIPEYDALKEWCKKQNLKYSNVNEMIGSSEVVKMFQGIINSANKRLASYERIRRFKLLSEAWSVETGDLTPTLKMKRRIIEKNFSDLIEQMYTSETI